MALFKQSENEVRLILTDLAMPVMDGTEMLANLRQRNSNIPVILMSGTYSHEKEALPETVTAFLAKPFRLEQLLTVVAETLRGKP